jgi:hypothetical protein
VGLAALAQPVVQAVQSVLGAPGDLEDVIGRLVLAGLERDPDPGRPSVVPGSFDQQPARVDRAGLGDRSLGL